MHKILQLNVTEGGGRRREGSRHVLTDDGVQPRARYLKHDYSENLNVNVEGASSLVEVFISEIHRPKL